MARAKAAEKAPGLATIVLRGDLKQRDVQAFELALLNVPGRRLVTLGTKLWTSTHAATCLKAAIEAGWVETPEVKYRVVTENGSEPQSEYIYDGVEVDDMEPLACFLAGSAVVELYHSFTNLDPN